MKCLITGATGFVASHLAEFLLKQKNVKKVFGTYRWRSPLDNIEHIKDKITLINCELTDLKSTRDMLEEVKPDIIFHLAAQSYVPAGRMEPRRTLETNAIGTLNLLEAIRLNKIDPKVHICSTADVYGQTKESDAVVTEKDLPHPASLYAVSKLTEDMLGLQYFLSYGIKTVRSRMSTHTGPRRGSVFVESAFAKQIAEIEAGKKEPVMYVGNLSAVRTFMDVGDGVRAYWELVNKGKVGEVYNISGEAKMTIQEMLDTLISFSDMKDKIKVKIDPKLLRPSDTKLPTFDDTKFRELTGWKPEISFEKTLKDLLDYWREKTKNG